jgi:hypothetical protein
MTDTEMGNGKMPVKTEAEKKKELERLKEWVKKILPNDFDKFDVEAEADLGGLSYVENKAQLRVKLKELFKDLKGDLEQKAKDVKAQQERLEYERRAEAEREASEYNKRVYTDNKDMDELYTQVMRGVEKICDGYSNLLFVRGRAGIGKSYVIRKVLLQRKIDFYEVCGDITPAYLYRLLFENNGKVIWFKDVVKLLNSGADALNLLKAATETEEVRLLTKNNYSKQQDDLPDRFVVKCKFIFDYNNLYGASALKEDFEALSSRGDYIEMMVSDVEITQMMRAIAIEQWQKEVTEYIIDHFKANGMVKLNLRTQWKAFRTYEWSAAKGKDWKTQLQEELQNISKVRGMLYSLIGPKIVKTTELKKLLLRHELVGTLRSADRKVQEYLYTEELFKCSDGDRDFLVSINAPQKEYN